MLPPEAPDRDPLRIATLIRPKMGGGSSQVTPKSPSCFRTCPNRQSSFKVGRIHLPTQFRFFLACRKAIELPGLIGTVFEHVGVEADFQSGLKRLSPPPDDRVL